MNFRNAKARQPEIVRSVQKDAHYTNDLSEDLSDILRLAGTRNWIKYNKLCKLIAEICYHGFSSINCLQTLGEEYTGVLQVDSKYEHIPSRLVSNRNITHSLFVIREIPTLTAWHPISTVNIRPLICTEKKLFLNSI